MYKLLGGDQLQGNIYTAQYLQDENSDFAISVLEIRQLADENRRLKEMLTDYTHQEQTDYANDLTKEK